MTDYNTAERSDKPEEECGIFGFYDNDKADVARMTYYGLYAQQHRGQESCGIVINDSDTIIYHKDMGYVNEVFNDVVLNHLKGQMALAHNRNLINVIQLRSEMEDQGLIFQSTIDSEVVFNLISKGLITSYDLKSSIESYYRCS